VSKELFFDLKANDISGRRIDFYIYKNRRAFLLVNVASNCGLAKDNYQMLN
jgi:glutathione peroxidase-family protein